MAFIDFADPAVSATNLPGAPTAPRADPVPPRATLSALEWSVVALARRDSIASLKAPGRIARAMAVIFGSRSETPFADPGLEALRRMAVHGWHRSFAVPEAEIGRFLQAGYSPDQLELLLTSISRARSARRRSN